jgi:hypothetical protein
MLSNFVIVVVVVVVVLANNITFRRKLALLSATLVIRR